MPVYINNITINGSVNIIYSNGGSMNITTAQQPTGASTGRARTTLQQTRHQQDGSSRERAIQIVDTDGPPPAQRRQTASPAEGFEQRGLSTTSSAPRSCRPRLTAARVSSAPSVAHSADAMARLRPIDTPQDSSLPCSAAHAGSSRDSHWPYTFNAGAEETFPTQATIQELNDEDESTSNAYSRPHRNSRRPHTQQHYSHHAPAGREEALRSAHAWARGAEAHATYEDEEGERSYTCVHQ